MVNLVEYELPESLACYAMYGPDSATGDESESAYDQWLSDTMAFEGFESMHLVDVSDGPGFMAWHALKEYGIGSADSVTFIFDARKKDS